MRARLVSVVVLNYNGAHLLRDCLESLLAQDYPEIEILVVDNGSVDDSRKLVGGYKDVRWVGLLRNEGLGPGYNAGAREAKGERLFFVNNDTRFAPDCVSQLVNAFRHDDILAADPLQMNWEGQRVIHGAQRFRLGWSYLSFGVPFLYPYQDLEEEKETEVPWGCAGALMFDRVKFDALGGFDSTFFTYYEDVDICWRGWLRGWRTIFVPASRVFHKVGETEDAKLREHNPSLANAGAPLVNSRRRLSHCKNAQRFIMKTMPWRMVAATLVVDATKALGNLLAGRPGASLLRAKATALNLKELPEILGLRRTVFRESVTTSDALMARWGRHTHVISSS